MDIGEEGHLKLSLNAWTLLVHDKRNATTNVMLTANAWSNCTNIRTRQFSEHSGCWPDVWGSQCLEKMRVGLSAGLRFGPQYLRDQKRKKDCKSGKNAAFTIGGTTRFDRSTTGREDYHRPLWAKEATR